MPKSKAKGNKCSGGALVGAFGQQVWPDIAGGNRNTEWLCLDLFPIQQIQIQIQVQQEYQDLRNVAYFVDISVLKSVQSG